MSLMITIDRTQESWVFDNTETLGRGMTNIVTAHPVERGADVADHVQRGQLRRSYGTLMTDTPREDSPVVGSGPERIDRCAEFLERCAGELLTLTHSLQGTQTNMLLASFSGDRGGVLEERFALEFTRLEYAEVTSVRVPPSAPIRNTTAASSLPDGQDLGAQATTTTAGVAGAGGSATGGASSAANADARDRSYLLQLLQGGGILQ